jgi:hypothetical protein
MALRSPLMQTCSAALLKACPTAARIGNLNGVAARPQPVCTQPRGWAALGWAALGWAALGWAALGCFADGLARRGRAAWSNRGPAGGASGPTFAFGCASTRIRKALWVLLGGREKPSGTGRQVFCLMRLVSSAIWL